MLAKQDKWWELKAAVLADLSPGSAEIYAHHLDRFRIFVDGRQLDKATVADFKNMLLDQGLAPSTVNVALAAVRKLVSEAADMGQISIPLAQHITSVKGVKSRGVRSGNWLDKKQANRLLTLPDRETIKGRRDVAILATLLFCGLRRSELTSMTLDHIQQREGHWVLVNLRGKGGRVRTVKLPVPVKRVIDKSLADRGELEPNNRVFVAMAKGDHIASETLTDQAIYNLCVEYSQKLGVEFSCHDLRRTSAKLAYGNGASLDSISAMLGHASMQTTERYLGLELDLDNAASDHIHLRIPNGE